MRKKFLFHLLCRRGRPCPRMCLIAVWLSKETLAAREQVKRPRSWRLTPDDLPVACQRERQTLRRPEAHHRPRCAYRWRRWWTVQEGNFSEFSDFSLISTTWSINGLSTRMSLCPARSRRKKKDSEIYFRQDHLNIIIKPAAIIALHKEIQSQ